jgi:hypothetical protein
MGKSFNKLLYGLIAIIIIAIVIIKFVFKRPLSVSELPHNQKKNHRAFKRKIIPVQVKPKNSRINTNTKSITKFRKRRINSKDVDFTSNGRSYHFLDDRNKEGQLVQDVHSGKMARFTGSLIVKTKSKQVLNNLLKKYQLTISKSFAHIGYYYLSGKSIEKTRKNISNILTDKSFDSVEFELLSHPVKIK